MKHGYTVVGRDKFGEFMGGSYDTKAAALKCYNFMMKSLRHSDATKRSLRIVELVERDITRELTS